MRAEHVFSLVLAGRGGRQPDADGRGCLEPLAASHPGPREPDLKVRRGGGGAVSVSFFFFSPASTCGAVRGAACGVRPAPWLTGRALVGRRGVHGAVGREVVGTVSRSLFSPILSLEPATRASRALFFFFLAGRGGRRPDGRRPGLSRAFSGFSPPAPPPPLEVVPPGVFFVGGKLLCVGWAKTGGRWRPPALERWKTGGSRACRGSPLVPLTLPKGILGRGGWPAAAHPCPPGPVQARRPGAYRGCPWAHRRDFAAGRLCRC